MKISVKNLSFGYNYRAADPGRTLFKNYSMELDTGGGVRPLIILGSSGCGKTTLLKLLGGLLKPQEGSVSIEGDVPEGKLTIDKTSFVFQEARLLPWFTVLKNVSVPLEKEFGRGEAEKRARHYLSLVSLEDKADSYPKELSGGQAQRVSMARAFAWPAPALFMDEPYQSLDIPLRIALMDLTLSLLKDSRRLSVIVTHDPREALYLGGRIIVLGRAGKGIVFDREIISDGDKREYGSASYRVLEEELIRSLKE